MSLSTPTLTRNAPFRFFTPSLGNPFLSLRSIPFLIVLAGGLATQAAVGASPVVKTIAITAPGGTESIIASPNRSEVYVADDINNRVAVIDTISNQIKSFISTANPAVGLGLSPDGNTLYVTEDGTVAPFNGFLEAISLNTSTQLFITSVEVGPTIPGISSDGSTVYVPCQSTGDIVPVGGPLLGAVVHIGGFPLDVVFNHNNTFAYASNETKNISVINTATGKVKKFQTNSRVFGLLISGRILYATGLGAIYVIDTNSNTVIDTIKLPTPPTGGKFLATLPAITPDGLFLYAPLGEVLKSGTTSIGNTMLVIDTRSNTIQSKFTVGNVPIQAAATANDTFGYSSNVDDGTVTAFDLQHNF